jgi:UDP-2,4-diacetamido-2,4,6-trideoxy-beta-L-altropyranose hydrolase
MSEPIDSQTPEVVFRAASGFEVGIGHAMRARAVAEAVRARGGRARFVLDDPDTAALFAEEGFETEVATDGTGWCTRPARGAWVDGFRDWSEELLALRAAGTRTFLVENRTASREHCDRVVYPSLHHVSDEWDRKHADRVLGGAPWIPLAQDVLEAPRDGERDLDLLVTFGGSDPLHSTERVLVALEGAPVRMAVAVGPHMGARREWIERVARDFPGAEVLPTGARLAPWMARSRVAVTALGTTLYELAYLGCPALIVANYPSDREAMRFYAEHGPHLPVGVTDELADPLLRSRLREARSILGDSSGVAGVLGRVGIAGIEELGRGAAALADLLLDPRS